MHINAFWPLTPKPGNLGDIITPFFLRKLGFRPRHVSQRAEGKFMGSGSIARFAKEGDILWGSGIIDSKDKIHPGAIPLCVRGPLTGAKCCCEVYGDPGLLMPLFVEACGKNSFDYMIFPHYVHVPLMRPEQPWIQPLTPDIARTCMMMSTANLMVSSSLHGIIIAHAYGVPAGWWKPDNKLSGDDVKFRDYANSVGITLQSAAKIEDVQFTLPDRERIVQLQQNLLTSINQWKLKTYP